MIISRLNLLLCVKTFDPFISSENAAVYASVTVVQISDGRRGYGGGDDLAGPVTGDGGGTGGLTPARVSCQSGRILCTSCDLQFRA